MSKNNFNKKIKFYEEIIDNIDLLTSNTETKYEVLNNIYHLIDTLGVNENLSIRKMGKQLKLMMYCDGQLNVVSGALKNELDKLDDEWVDVKDGLPIKDGEYLVSFADSDYVCTADFKIEGCNPEWGNGAEIIAWQPLPKSYKRNKQRENQE